MTKAPSMHRRVRSRSKKSHALRLKRSARRTKVQKEIDQEAMNEAIDNLIERLKTCDGHEECKSGSGSTRSGRSRKKRTRL